MRKKTKAKESCLVFISHSEKDRWIAKQMANLIEKRNREYGLKVFLEIWNTKRN